MTVKVEYDPVVDAAYIRFSHEDIIETEEVSQGIMLDFDKRRAGAAGRRGGWSGIGPCRPAW
jgi:hypothetical protein